MKVFYNDNYVAAKHAFDTTRKAKAIAESLVDDPIKGLDLEDPSGYVSLSEQMIQNVHDERYVAALRTGFPRDLAQSSSFPWDEGIWTMAVASTAGVLAATNAALVDGIAGSLSSGLHHARYSHGAGFCTVNGLAVAAKYAADRTGGSVVILDLDAHAGGGTYSLIHDDPRIVQLDLAVSAFDLYEPVYPHWLEVNPRISDKGYLDSLRGILYGARAVCEGLPKLIIYNAGMDPHGIISRETLAEREQRVMVWAKLLDIPLMFVLAGGYTGLLSSEGLVQLHRYTLEAAAHWFS